MSGARTLGELDGQLNMLRVVCMREGCGRRGRYHLSKLIDKHGRQAKLPDIARFLSRDCPQRNVNEMDRCLVQFPDLSKL